MLLLLLILLYIESVRHVLFVMMMQNNKERHFCFVYYGNTMHFPFFSLLNLSSAEGFSQQVENDDETTTTTTTNNNIEGGRTVQFVRISLNQKSGKRASAIPRVIDSYNNMDGRSEEKVEPVVYFPSIDGKREPVICFKKAAPIERNPILSRIDKARIAMDQRYWRWDISATTALSSSRSLMTTNSLKFVSSSSDNNNHHHHQRTSVSTAKRHAVTSVSDILACMKLPESVVSVQRAYDELSEPYFRKFNSPLGEGTGCIPMEHREFIVSEIQRLFEVELCYIQQPSVVEKNGGCLPPNAIALVDHGGWMGDVLLAGGGGDCIIMDTVKGGSIICDLRVENSMARKVYIRTGKTHSDKLEYRGVGHSLREFFIFYALEWNNAGNGSVFEDIGTLHAAWTSSCSRSGGAGGSSETFSVFRCLISGIGLSSYVTVEGSMLRVPSVERLLELLCSEGLIVVSGMMMTKLSVVQPVAVVTPTTVVVKRMTVLENCTPVASILGYFKRMLGREWVGIPTVEVTAIDVVKALNGGDVGAYRRSCVSQFMRPFLFDGSVEGYSWKEGCVHLEKYIINVESVSIRVASCVVV